MSAGGSDPAADPSGSGPPFPVVDWGYERHLVDFRVAELVQQLAQARRRGDQSEHALLQLQLKLHTGRGHGPDGAVKTDPAQVLQRAGVIAAGVLAEGG